MALGPGPWKHEQMTPTNIEDVRLHRALDAAAWPDEHAAWDLVVDVHRTGGQRTLSLCQDLVRDPDPQRRRVAIDVLGQLDWAAERGVDPVEVVEVLRPLLASERDPRGIAALITAFGLREVSPGERYLAAAAKHDEPEVRRALAVMLPSFEQHEAVPLLLVLSGDDEAEVRNWATFGIGTQFDECESHDIRETLLTRANDSHDETRLEAMIGLARRGDTRVAPLLEDELRADEPYHLAIEAAGLLGAPQLLTALADVAARHGDEAVAIAVEQIEERMRLE